MKNTFKELIPKGNKEIAEENQKKFMNGLLTLNKIRKSMNLPEIGEAGNLHVSQLEPKESQEQNEE